MNTFVLVLWIAGSAILPATVSAQSSAPQPHQQRAAPESSSAATARKLAVDRCEPFTNPPENPTTPPITPFRLSNSTIGTECRASSPIGSTAISTVSKHYRSSLPTPCLAVVPDSTCMTRRRHMYFWRASSSTGWMARRLPSTPPTWLKYQQGRNTHSSMQEINRSSLSRSSRRSAQRPPE